MVRGGKPWGFSEPPAFTPGISVRSVVYRGIDIRTPMASEDRWVAKAGGGGQEDGSEGAGVISRGAVRLLEFKN